jgi:hypothetical protein
VKSLFPTACSLVSAIFCLIGGIALNSPVTIGFGVICLVGTLALGAAIVHSNRKARQ